MLIDAKSAPYAALLLRLTTGILFLLHGLYLKVFVFTLAGTAGFFGSLGLPGWFGWVVMLYETIGGILLILGVYTRWVAAFLGIHLLFAALLAHVSKGFWTSDGGWEFPVFWAITMFALALIGDGAYAARPAGSSASAGRWV